MRINETGLNLIKSYEGCSLVAYQCPANIWTIGYGNTEYLKQFSDPSGIRITQEKADELFAQNIEKFENGVSAIFTQNLLNDNQFSALVSFAYNVGLRTLRRSSLLRYIEENPNNFDFIRYQFLKWDHVGTRVLSGLLKRREAEFNLYSTH